MTEAKMTEAKTRLSKDQALTAVAVIILLFSAMIDWSVYSWLVLLAVILILAAWYLKK
jgi:Flp pilus assembly protein TadB